MRAFDRHPPRKGEGKSTRPPLAREQEAHRRASLGPVISPCHITLRPRTKVPTGQPVTLSPSNGVKPQREPIHLFVIVSWRLRSTTVRSASKPSAILPLAAMPKMRDGPALVRSTKRASV